jgi:centrin-1
MKALGIHLDKKQVKLLMEKADKDGSGSIDLEEFTSLMAEKIHARDTKDELKKAFWMYDDDEGGTIGFDNLQRAAEDLNTDLTDQEINMMIEFADTKDLGEVDLDDFFRVMREAKLYEEKPDVIKKDK